MVLPASAVRRCINLPKGQSLVEVLGAFAVLVVVVLSLVAVTTRSVYNAAFARDQAKATQYGQEAIERIRAYRDQSSWPDFTSACESVLDAWPLPAPFSRVVDCHLVGGVGDCSAAEGRCEVAVILSWTDNYGVHESCLTTRLTDWR